METGNKVGSLEDFESVLGIKPDATEVVTPPAQPEVVETPPTPEPQAAPQENVESVETPTTPNGQETQQTSFDINEFNKRFAVEFTDEDSIKSAVASSQETVELKTKLQAFEEQLKELESIKEQNALLKENLDPMKYFTSEDEFKEMLFRKQFPDKDASTAHKLFTMDIGQLSDTDVLAYEAMLDTPGLDKKNVMEVINKRYGIEEGEDIDAVTSTEMKIDANKARKSINSLKSQVQLPDKIDADSLAAQQRELQEQKKQRLSEGWKGISKEIVNTLPDIVVKDVVDGKEVELFRYAVDKDFPQDVVESVAQYMASTGNDVSQDAAKVAAEVFQKEYFYRNHSKILKSAIDHIKAVTDEERLRAQHNPGTPKPSAVPSSTTPDYDDKVIAGVNRGWRPSNFF